MSLVNERTVARIPQADDAATNNQSLTSYYQFHSKVYDLSRWSFLFGRRAIIQLIDQVTTAPGSINQKPERILEVGCGTGVNLRGLRRRFADAALVGIDLSEDMLKLAHKKVGHSGNVTLQHGAYGEIDQTRPFDIILFSYALTMFNPGWDVAIEQAYKDLKPGGHVAVVDFHDAPAASFKKWMGVNHVRMDSHLQPKLQEHFTPYVSDVRPAYGGLWTYLLFVGQK